MSPHRSAHWDAPGAAGQAPGYGVAPMEERPQRGQYGERGYCAAPAAHGMGPGLRGPTGIAAGRLHDRAERVDGLEQAPTAFVACWKPPPSARASSVWTPRAARARRGAAPIAAEDQARVIVGILEDPASHRGKIYPLYGPVEFTYKEIAQVLSRVLGKDVQYKQVSIETMLQIMASGGQKPPAEHSARAMYGEFASSRAERWALEQKPEGRTGDSFFIQHLREVAIDHQNGVFAGTNDVVETIGGRPATTLDAFINKHRAAFA
jgi:hypothetical protein